jgi:HYR domain-containing protein
MAATAATRQHRGMKRSLTGAATVALVAAAVASATTESTAATLPLNGVLAFTQQGTTPVACPPGTPDTTACLPTTGHGIVPGLGAVVETYTLIANDYETTCNHWHFNALLTIANKGEIDVVASNPDCIVPQSNRQPLAFTVTGGTGIYVGASGTGSITETVSGGSGATVSGTDAWSGTLTVPNLNFDTTPPKLAGAISKTVTTKTPAGVHVRYTPTATDAVDGPLPVNCKPKSGALFPVRRTIVTCTATDTSGNTASVRFTVTVKRAEP